ncbi:cobalamin-dependent protein [candidate division WOR-3 bacterium]|nr:cobalamin-dependent protein [candidate division WOR-3 bacterium]
MRVALLNPRVGERPYPPLGLLYIASVLENNGFEVRIWDPHPDDLSFLSDIKKFNPRVVGLTVTTPQVNKAKYLVEEIRKSLPLTKLVAGGVHITALPSDSLKNLDLDCVVIGEGELTMLEICQRLNLDEPLDVVKGIAYRKNGRIARNENRELIENLDDVPFPARHLVDFGKYLMPPGTIRGLWLERSTAIITSRGCPYHCIFCGSHLIFGKQVRRRSVANVISEIELLISQYEIDGLWFFDDTFTLDKGWVKEFVVQMKEHKINLKWSVQSRVNPISIDILDEMKSAGLSQIEFGVESGSDKVLKALKKGTTVEMIKNAFRITKKVGIRTCATFMVGNPSETKKDILMTQKLAREIAPDWTTFFFATPYPGTELLEMANKNNWIVDNDYSNWVPKMLPVIEINFKREEVVKIRARLQSRFVFNNYIKLFKNPRYFIKLIGLFLRFPMGLLKGMQNFLKLKTVDDFVFGFIEYYRKSKYGR